MNGDYNKQCFMPRLLEAQVIGLHDASIHASWKDRSPMSIITTFSNQYLAANASLTIVSVRFEIPMLNKTFASLGFLHYPARFRPTEKLKASLKVAYIQSKRESQFGLHQLGICDFPV